MRRVKGLVGAILASSVFLHNADAASWRTELPPIVEKPKVAIKYEDNIINVRLMIEEGYGTIPADYEFVAKFLDDADQCFPTNVVTKKDALKTLYSMHSFIVGKNFACVTNSGSQDFLNNGIKQRVLDCDNFATLYLGIGEKKGYPIQAIAIPRHVLVQWKLPEGNRILWETTCAKERDEKEIIFTWKSNKWDNLKYDQKSFFGRPLEQSLREPLSKRDFIDSLPDICTGGGFSIVAHNMYGNLVNHYTRQIALFPDDKDNYTRRIKIWKRKEEAMPKYPKFSQREDDDVPSFMRSFSLLQTNYDK